MISNFRDTSTVGASFTREKSRDSEKDLYRTRIPIAFPIRSLDLSGRLILQETRNDRISIARSDTRNRERVQVTHVIAPKTRFLPHI